MAAAPYPPPRHLIPSTSPPALASSSTNRPLHPSYLVNHARPNRTLCIRPTVLHIKPANQRLSIACRASSLNQNHCLQDPYRTLGVTHGATEDDIKKAYRKLALRFHPDVCKGDSCTVTFTRISDAYQTIMDCLKGDHGSMRVVSNLNDDDEVLSPEPMMGVNDESWEDWEEWMGWEGAGTRDYSNHINHSL